ncbi:hypothetical protein B2J93_8815 [Marssonina coronariae]|uniref:Uncharacterized protein n=1 Tax=Diplocarpon coronariae TaxID=2795749 RepID=A0A218ZFJ2_9HELO|nr:hypothetical protein B2J93_8815 [Marssonina coronariae]
MRFFIMIKASRIDHIGPNDDSVGHLHDIIQYNEVMDIMLSGAADECGGLTLLDYNPLILKAANTYVEFLFTLFNEYTGPSPSELLRTSVPRYGLTTASEAEIATLEGHEDDISWPNALRKTLSERGGMNRSASDYSAIDAMLCGYSSGKGHGLLRQNTAGNWEDTQFSRYMEQQLGVD